MTSDADDRVSKRLSLLARARQSIPPESLYPAVVLTMVWAVDQFDTTAFTNFYPNVAASLNVSQYSLQIIVLPQIIVAALLPLIFGYLGDTRNRRRIVAGGMLIWSISIILTGLAWTLPLLLICRLIAVAPKAPAAVNQSMLGDYYPVKSRGFVMSMYVSAPVWGAGLGVLIAGVIVEPIWGWRWGLIALGVPGLIVTGLVLRMREPRRGIQETKALGETDPPIAGQLGIVRTFRRLFSIPSFRWICYGEALILAGAWLVIVSGAYFFQNVFDLGAALRGLIIIAPIPFAVVILIVVGRIGQRYILEGRSNLVLVLTAVGVALVGVFYFIEAIAGNVWIAAAAYFLAVLSSAAIQSPIGLLMYDLVPVGIRSQAYGVIVFCQYVLVPFAILAGGPLGATFGYRLEIAAAAPYFVLGAMCCLRASNFCKTDVARAAQVLNAEFEQRKRRAAGERSAVLEVQGLAAAYGGVQVLFSVDVHVDEGETVALLGTNGAGKSTLLRTICGLMPATNGVMLVDGEDVSGVDAEVMAEHGVVLVPGGKGVFPRMSVARNLDLGSYTQWRSSGRDQRRRDEVLDLFPKLRERLGQSAGTLSGGEQQMLALARALMGKPRLLLIDELSIGLSPVVVEELLRVVEELQARGTTMIIVEQSVNIALTLAKRAYFMEKGEIRFSGAAQDLVHRTDLLRSIFLEGARGDAGAPDSLLASGVVLSGSTGSDSEE